MEDKHSSSRTFGSVSVRGNSDSVAILCTNCSQEWRVKGNGAWEEGKSFARNHSIECNPSK